MYGGVVGLVAARMVRFASFSRNFLSVALEKSDWEGSMEQTPGVENTYCRIRICSLRERERSYWCYA